MEVAYSALTLWYNSPRYFGHSQCLCIPFRNDKVGLNHTDFVVAELVGMSIPHAPFLPFFALALNYHKGLGFACLIAQGAC